MDGRPHRVGNVFIEHVPAASSHSGGVVPLAPFFEVVMCHIFSEWFNHCFTMILDYFRILLVSPTDFLTMSLSENLRDTSKSYVCSIIFPIKPYQHGL